MGYQNQARPEPDEYNDPIEYLRDLILDLYFDLSDLKYELEVAISLGLDDRTEEYLLRSIDFMNKTSVEIRWAMEQIHPRDNGEE